MSEDTKEWWLMVISGKSTFVIQLWAELATIFMELIFSWQPTEKLWLSDFSVWQTFSQKKKKCRKPASLRKTTDSIYYND